MGGENISGTSGIIGSVSNSHGGKEGFKTNPDRTELATSSSFLVARLSREEEDAAGEKKQQASEEQ